MRNRCSMANTKAVAEHTKICNAGIHWDNSTALDETMELSDHDGGAKF